MLNRASSCELRPRFEFIVLHWGVSDQKSPDRRRRAVVLVQARSGPDERGPGGIVLLEERGRGRDEGEVELDEGLLVEVRKSLLEEVDPASDECGHEVTRQEKTYWALWPPGGFCRANSEMTICLFCSPEQESMSG